MNRKYLSIIICLCMCFLLGACGSKKVDKESEKDNSAIATVYTNDGKEETITFDELIKQYDGNEAAFKKKYLYADIEFEGTIKQIKTETSVIVKEGAITANGNIIYFEEGWALALSVSNESIDLSNYNVGDIVTVKTSIFGAPFDTEFLKEVSEGNRVLWLVGNDKFNYDNALPGCTTTIK